MNLQTLIKKIEKYLTKDKKYLMRETDVLEELKDEIKEIGIAFKRAKDDKHVKALQLYYKNQARRKERFSERIERRLNIWIRRLERLLSKEEEELPAERKHLEEFKTHIEICRTNLVRILAWEGELHTLIKTKEPDWKEVKAKVDEALGDAKKNPGIRSLVLILGRLESFEERIEKEGKKGLESKKKVSDKPGVLRI